MASMTNGQIQLAANFSREWIKRIDVTKSDVFLLDKTHISLFQKTFYVKAPNSSFYLLVLSAEEF